MLMLDGKTVYFLGKLAASNRREASAFVRRLGGRIARKLGPSVALVVVGEGNDPLRDWTRWNEKLDAETREAFESGSLEIVSEAFFWNRYGGETNETERNIPPAEPLGPLYTPSMLAELSGLPVSVIRRLQRQGLLVPVRRVHRLCYFGLENILPLKIVRELSDAGLSFSKIIERLQKIKRHLPEHSVDVHIDGNDVLLVTERGPIDQNGQGRFAFVLDAGPDAATSPAVPAPPDPLAILESVFQSDSGLPDVPTLCEAAWQLESDGNLRGAVELYRTALAVGGPNAQINFQIAELLYRLGDLGAARERYFAAVELDEEFVEARANLGCVLAELGNDELAVAAFRGALRHHPDYVEVHFHLGMVLRRNGLEEEARRHLDIFLEMMPDSPWADRIENPEAGARSTG